MLDKAQSAVYSPRSSAALMTRVLGRDGQQVLVYMIEGMCLTSRVDVCKGIVLFSALTLLQEAYRQTFRFSVSLSPQCELVSVVVKKDIGMVPLQAIASQALCRSQKYARMWLGPDHLCVMTFVWI